jgi:SpoVK/Ycf46/Vps4 family AAA+-type ATPase
MSRLPLDSTGLLCAEVRAHHVVQEVCLLDFPLILFFSPLCTCAVSTLQTNATFLKLAGPQLVQMFIGDGAKMVRDAFALAKEKQPAIIFIDEIDAIGTKRFDSELSGDREVQRTMLELLNQLDGFTSNDNVKVRGYAWFGSWLQQRCSECTTSRSNRGLYSSRTVAKQGLSVLSIASHGNIVVRFCPAGCRCHQPR